MNVFHGLLIFKSGTYQRVGMGVLLDHGVFG